MGIRVTRTGTRASVRDAPCIVANHISATDILALLSLGCCFVANNKVLDLPGIGRVAKAIGCIFVARDSQESRTSAKEAITQRLLEPSLISDSPDSQLVIFPEGTTTNGRGLIQFRRGAFESGVTIQPVRIDYSDLQCSMALLSIWELVCLLAVLGCDKEISVHFLEPVSHTGTPDDMASLVRSKIANTKTMFNAEPLQLFASGSHRDEAEMTKIISRMQPTRQVRESM
jgi:1-acyl-sn-glycerol-3-phosphate acyltransferase